MTVGSLFSGIGGLELGLERAGMTVKWQVELDPYCRRVLAKHWPDVTRYEDVRDVGEANLEPVDLICGGFPCQPVSQAGKRLAQDDPRWLWPEFARIIRELRPRCALVENVPGLLVRGFGDVLGDLAEAGYDAEWCVLGADDVGAPHRRKRVLVVAYADRSGRDRTRTSVVGPDRWTDGGDDIGGSGSIRDAHREHEAAIDEPRGVTDGLGEDGQLDDATSSAGADPKGLGQPRAGSTAEQERSTPRGVGEERGNGPEWWRVEPDVGRVAHGVPHRVERLGALGNAVVPQVSEWIGRRIMEAA